MNTEIMDMLRIWPSYSSEIQDVRGGIRDERVMLYRQNLFYIWAKYFFKRDPTNFYKKSRKRYMLSLSTWKRKWNAHKILLFQLNQTSIETLTIKQPKLMTIFNSKRSLKEHYIVAFSWYAFYM